MAAASIATFKESPRSPWGQSRSKARGEKGPLPDAFWPAQATHSSEVVGCISYVNSYISEAGLRRRNSLPPLIFDLYTPPRERYPQELKGDLSSMAHRRGKAVRKKRASKSSLSTKPQSKTIIKGIDLDEKTADTQLIELATYPGFNPHNPTPLPHGLDTLEQMKRVTSAQMKISTKHEGYRKAWCQFFYSSFSQAIFLDYYWWFFLHWYQKNQLPVQDQLFSRISKNYVKMICEIERIDHSWKDLFFKMYPDILAQCVYSTFIHAYPNSWNSFDENFKTELTQYISLWQVGIKPMPESWKKWEFHLLEPPNLLKYIGKNISDDDDDDDDDDGDHSRKKAGREKFDLDALIKKEAKRLEREVIQSCSVPPTSPSFETVKNALSGSKGMLVAFVRRNESIEEEDTEGLVPSVSEEKRIGIVMEQFNNLEKNSQAKHSSATTSKSRVCFSSNEDHTVSSSNVEDQPSGSNSLKNQRKTIISASRGPSFKETEIQKRKLHQQQRSRKSAPGKVPQSGKCTQSTQIKSGNGENLKSTQSTQIKSGNGENLKSSQVESKSNVSTSSDITVHTNSGKKFTGTLKKMALSFRDRSKQQDEPITLKGPEFEHALFNIYGHSPLVRHYMNEMDMSHTKEKEIVVGRTEISEEPPQDAACYKVIMAQSKATVDKHKATFQRQYKKVRQSIANAEKTRLSALHKHEENVKLLLANKREVKQLSDELTVHVLQPKIEVDRVAMSDTIDKSLQRVTKKH